MKNGKISLVVLVMLGFCGLQAEGWFFGRSASEPARDIGSREAPVKPPHDFYNSAVIEARALEKFPVQKGTRTNTLGSPAGDGVPLEVTVNLGEEAAGKRTSMENESKREAIIKAVTRISSFDELATDVSSGDVKNKVRDRDRDRAVKIFGEIEDNLLGYRNQTTLIKNDAIRIKVSKLLNEAMSLKKAIANDLKAEEKTKSFFGSTIDNKIAKSERISNEIKALLRNAVRE